MGKNKGTLQLTGMSTSNSQKILPGQRRTYLVRWRKEPERDDIIVFKYPNDKKRDFIKRLIGLPGETIEIRDKDVFINGKLLDESYAEFKDSENIFNKNHPAFYIDPYARNRDNYGPRTIPEDSYFMMGDNRDRSADSRFWGFVNLNKVKGKAFLIYWSWGSFMRDIKWRRIGKLIH